MYILERISNKISTIYLSIYLSIYLYIFFVLNEGRSSRSAPQGPFQSARWEARPWPSRAPPAPSWGPLWGPHWRSLAFCVFTYIRMYMYMYMYMYMHNYIYIYMYTYSINGHPPRTYLLQSFTVCTLPTFSDTSLRTRNSRSPTSGVLQIWSSANLEHAWACLLSNE